MKQLWLKLQLCFIVFAFFYPASLFSNNFINDMHYFVDQNANSNQQDGSSWENAFNDLQSALLIAEEGDIVWVAEGTYKPTQTNIRAISFQIPNGVQIYGGFNGTESTLEERDFENHPTILSGNIGSISDSTDNSLHVLVLTSVDSTTIIDGFQIEHGFAKLGPSQPLSNSRGAAIYLGMSEDANFCYPIIKNCTFQYNVALEGGAIYCERNNQGSAGPLLDHCRFYNNHADFLGGAVYKEGAYHEISTPQIKDCSFIQNSANISGGGLTIQFATNSYSFQNIEFENNYCTSMGSAFHFESLNENGKLDLINCNFRKNHQIQSGALALALHSNSTDSTYFDVNIIGCNFIENQCPTGPDAGIALYSGVDVANISIENSLFNGNFCKAKGAAISIDFLGESVIRLFIDRSIFKNNYSIQNEDAVIYYAEYTDQTLFFLPEITIRNSLFYNNPSGALVLDRVTADYGTAKIINSTFYNNGEYPISKTWNGSTSFEESFPQIEIYNSIIWEPQALLPQILQNNNQVSSSLYGYKISNCLFSSNPCEAVGGENACLEGILSEEDPMFMDPENEDFRLHPCSPAINMGSNDFLNEENMDIDLGGEDRINASFVDLGAYETERRILLITVDIGNSVGDANNGYINITSVFTGVPPFQFEWNTGSQDSIITDLAPGDYFVTITDAEGCEFVWVFTIDIIDNLNEPVKDLNFDLYPNPVKTQLNINFESNQHNALKNARILIINSSGQIYKEVPIQSDNISIPLFNLAPGQYYCQLINNNQVIQSKAFILQN
jgi:predicted outer membrane repeat protein